MIIRALDIEGYRGFATRQRITFAIPNGTPGSGLTVVVGPNNSGKSTIVEALRLFGNNSPPSFTEGKRNKKASDRVALHIEYGDDKHRDLCTVAAGGSETVFDPPAGDLHGTILALPSRRYFPPFFSRSTFGRREYSANMANMTTRSAPIDTFAYRLFEVQERREAFNAVLARVLDPVPEWRIDQADSGQHYLKFESNGLFHNSDGLGDGLVSLLFLVDALYDSQDGQVIAVDEPELSLHPALQRRLADLLVDYAAKRQVVVSTHSPYFLPLQALAVGAAVVRVFLGQEGSHVAQVSPESAAQLRGFLTDLNNPHVLGLDAREVFFLEDGLILVEGQEDVLSYTRLAEQLGIKFKGAFFGWGVGGAEKMAFIASILSDLSFRRVVGILDGNRQHLAEELRRQFPQYSFLSIPTPDVRSKPPSPARDAVEGLLSHDGTLRDEHREAARALIMAVNAAL